MLNLLEENIAYKEGEMMTIRPATSSDIPVILELLDQILKIHHAARPDLFTATGTKFSTPDLEKRLADASKPIFVSVDEHNHVRGHLFLEIRESQSAVRKPVKSLFIEDLCVADGFRGLGLGRELYHYAKTYAQNNGCYNLTLNVWNANKGATDFYSSLGMLAQQTQMEEIL